MRRTLSRSALTPRMLLSAHGLSLCNSPSGTNAWGWVVSVASRATITKSIAKTLWRSRSVAAVRAAESGIRSRSADFAERLTERERRITLCNRDKLVVFRNALLQKRGHLKKLGCHRCGDPTQQIADCTRLVKYSFKYCNCPVPSRVYANRGHHLIVFPTMVSGRRITFTTARCSIISTLFYQSRKRR